MGNARGSIKTNTIAHRLPVVCDALVALGIPILSAWPRNGGGIIHIELEGRSGPYRVSTTTYDVTYLHTVITSANPPTTTGDAIRLMLTHCRRTTKARSDRACLPIWINPKIAQIDPASP